MNLTQEIVFDNLIDPSTSKHIRLVIELPSPQYLAHLKAMELAGSENGKRVQTMLKYAPEDT